jgi:hypothetical protein
LPSGTDAKEAVMNVFSKTMLRGGALALALLAVIAGPSFAQPAPPHPAPGPMPGQAPTHEQMHQMIDDMHGPGTSQRMHEAMGSDAERMIDQLVAAHGMMQQMHAMMAGGGMAAMPEDHRRMTLSMMAMMEETMTMMLGMVGMMGSMHAMGMMPEHQAMMERMMATMQSTMTAMREMMGVMQNVRGSMPGPGPAPAQVPRR